MCVCVCVCVYISMYIQILHFNCKHNKYIAEESHCTKLSTCDPSRSQKCVTLSKLMLRTVTSEIIIMITSSNANNNCNTNYAPKIVINSDNDYINYL